MTREEARQNLVALGIEEPSEAQVTNYLNQFHSNRQNPQPTPAPQPQPQPTPQPNPTPDPTPLNKEMIEIPARIDEVSKQLEKVNVSELEIEKLAKEVALKKVEDELAGGTEKTEEINAKREQVMNLKFDLSDISNKETEILMEKRRGAVSEYNEVEEKLMDITRLTDADYWLDYLKQEVDDNGEALE